MNILKNEILKLITIKNIIIIAVITFIGYNRQIIHWAEYNDHNNIVKDVSVQMIKDYGNELDKEEFEDFKNKYHEKVKIAETYIKGNKEFSDLEIYDYNEYFKITRNSGEEKYNDEKLLDLYFKYQVHDDIKIFNELNELENRLIVYDHEISNNPVYYNNITSNYDKENKYIYENRERELIESGQYLSIMPYRVFEDYDAQIKALTRIIIVCIVVVISLVYISDKNNKVEYLQYSSKYGRKLFKTKIFASLITIFLIVTVQIFIFIKFYSTQDIGLFLDCYASGHFNSPMMSWYDLTFRDYIGVTIIGVYSISFIMGLLSMYVSSKAKTYMSLLGIQVPIILFVNMFGLEYLINNMTSMYYNITRLGTVSVPRYTLETVFIVLLISSIFIMYVRNKKELKAEIS